MDTFKKYISLFFSFFLIFILVFSVSCSKKTGCPGEDAAVKVNKKGMPTSKPKSGLFDKKMTKKISK
jgi:hypothetical protein